MVTAFTVLVAVAAAVGAVLSDGDVEITLLMLSAVIATLAAFDRAMRSRGSNLWPWLLLSTAPVLKTVPTVWHELRAESGASFEQLDHAGSLAFGIAILGALTLLAVPGSALGGRIRRFAVLVIAGSATTAALAGASVAFLQDAALGSLATARLLESGAWFAIGGILAAVVLGVAVRPVPTWPYVAVAIAAAAISAQLAASTAGRDFDRGWWAAAFAALAASTVLGSDLGACETRVRRSSAPAVVAAVGAVVGAAAAISARTDRGAWNHGWAFLAVASLFMLALALGYRADNTDGVRSERATDALSATPPPHSSSDDEPPGADPGAVHTVAPQSAPVDRSAIGDRGQRQLSTDADVEPAVEAPVTVLSDEHIVAAARTAAEIRTAPLDERHDLAPLDRAHHFDPSTGLLSAAGFQHAVLRAFDVPRQAGHVTVVLFMIRNIDQIERDHGRLVSAQVTDRVADRIRLLLPRATAARFGRAAYAVIFVGDLSDSAEATSQLARAMVQMRAPIHAGSFVGRLDAAAGMAQCRDHESAIDFLDRANDAFARAVSSEEPTFVAMS